MTLQGMLPVTGKVQVTSLLPHKLWHSVLNFIFWIMQALNDRRKVFMVYEAPVLFFIFPQRLRSDEGVDIVFPVKDRKKPLKNA